MNPYPSTTTQEFLHTANLPHSFSAYESSKYAKFTYDPLVTDNIMDYSDVYPKTSSSNLISTISLYNWQSKLASENSEIEP